MSEKDVEVVLAGDAYVQRPDPDSAIDYVGPKYVKPAEIPDVVKHVEQVSSRFGCQFEVREVSGSGKPY